MRSSMIWRAALCLALVLPGVVEAELWVSAKASAPIWGGDVDSARHRAVRMALVKGLEQGRGLEISAASTQISGKLVQRHLLTRTRGFVREWQVEQVRQNRHEIEVEVRLQVGSSPTLQTLEHLFAGRRTLLVTPAISVAAVREPTWNQHLESSGLEWTGLLKADVALPGTSCDVLKSSRVLRLAEAHRTEFVLCLSVATEILGHDLGYSVRPEALRPVASASAHAELYSGRTGELIGFWKVEDLRGSDAIDPERAQAEALKSAARAMGSQLIHGIAETLRHHGWSLRVRVTGNDGARLAEARERLEQVAWVEAVQTEAQAPGEISYRVQCKDDPILVLEELRAMGGFEIRHYSSLDGELELRAL